MKVLHIETGMNLYGGPQQVCYLLEGLHARGIRNILACPEGSAIAEAAAPFAEQIIILRPGLVGVRDFNEALRQTTPDLLHVHSRRLGVDWWAAWSARRARVPALVSRRVDTSEPGWLARLKYRPYSRVIAISEGIRRVLLDTGLQPTQVVTVRSAVDPAPYLHNCESSAFRETFGLAEGTVTLGVIAQLILRKGHRHLFEALPDIVASHPETRVLIFGKGPLRETLETEVSRLGLQDHVSFVGFRTDLPRWLPCLDMVVHPADTEGLGVSLLQAAAAKVPVVACRSGGIPEAVLDGKTGLLVEPGNVPALRDAILRLLDDADGRRAMGEAGQHYVLSACDTKTMVEGNLAVYQTLSQPRRR